MVKSTNKTKKLPPPLPEWICKACWDATDVKLIVPAKDEKEAWDRAWKKVARTEGGDSCLRVVVLGRKS